MVRLNRDLRFYVLSLFLFSFGMGLYSFLLPVYAVQLGADPAQLGLIYAIGMAVGTGASLFGGYLADRFDKKWIIFWCWAVCVPIPLLFAWATSWQWLIPGLVLFYSSFFGNGAINAYVVSKADPARLAGTMTFVFAAFPLGSVFSPALGGWLAENFSFQTVFYLTFVCYLLSTLTILPLSPAPPGERGTVTKLSFKFPRPVVRFCLLCALTQAALGLALPFINPFLQDIGGYSLNTLGLLSSLSAGAAVFLAPLLGRLADQSRRLAYFLGITLTAIGLWLVLPHSLALVVAGHFILRSSFEGTRGQMSAQLGSMLDSNRLGQGYAFFSALNSMAGTFAPYLGGLLFGFSPQWTFGLSGALLLLMLPSLMASQASQHQDNHSPAPCGDKL